MMDTSSIIPGDKIIYLGYLLRTGKMAIHTVVHSKPNEVWVKDSYKDATFRIGDLSEFCTLEDAMEKYPEEFI